ncbi:MAG: hypothetical protein RR185_09905 [Angelakisella sp.]
MWYRDTGNGCDIFYADTADFCSFTEPRLAVKGHAEGPNVFALGGWYWLITDPLGRRQGLAVYRSSDLTSWTQMDNILDKDGVRPFDNSKGRHADVAVQGQNGYIFYFTQPYKDYSQPPSYTAVQDSAAVCVVQCAHLTVLDGCLCCDRNEDFELQLGALINSPLHGG